MGGLWQSSVTNVCGETLTGALNLCLPNKLFKCEAAAVNVWFVFEVTSGNFKLLSECNFRAVVA